MLQFLRSSNFYLNCPAVSKKIFIFVMAMLVEKFMEFKKTQGVLLNDVQLHLQKVFSVISEVLKTSKCFLLFVSLKFYFLYL